MAEFSMFPWETQTGVGDGANSYTQDQANAFFRYFDVRNPANEGVVKGVLIELAVTGVASPLSVNTGAAICYGRYWNDSAKTLAVTTPAVGTTGGRVILRATWATNTIRLVAVRNTDGNAGIPAMTQIAGTTWEISLATFSITVGGVITVTDDRTFRLVTGILDTDDVKTAMIQNDAVTVGKIPNRTRRLFVPVVSGYNSTDVVELTRSNNNYLVFPDAKTCHAQAIVAMPSDYASGLIAYGVACPATTGAGLHVSAGISARGINEGAVGFAGQGDGVSVNEYDVILDGGTLGAALNTYNTEAATGSLTSTGFLLLAASRVGANPADTMTANMFFQGWLIEYTADS